MYTYSWVQWMGFFFIYCFFGWIFESAYVSLKTRHFVNRGFLRLPMLPLYGTGAVMMLWISLPVKDNLYLVYLSGVTGATLLEYITGYVMEKLFKMKYWDYSSQRFQLHGYICLSSSIAWGFLTIFLTEVIHRPIERFILGINPVLAAVAAAAISFFFIADSIQSVKAALDLGRVLEAMTKMRAELDDMQVQLALLKAQTVQRVNEIKDETSQKVYELKQEILQGAQAAYNSIDTNSNQKLDLNEIKVAAAQLFDKKQEELLQKMLSLNEKRHSLFEHLGSHKSSILRNNPSISAARFNEALKEIKEQLGWK